MVMLEVLVLQDHKELTVMLEHQETQEQVVRLECLER